MLSTSASSIQLQILLKHVALSEFCNSVNNIQNHFYRFIRHRCTDLKWKWFMQKSCSFSTFSQKPVGDPQVGAGWGEDASSLKPPCPLLGACNQLQKKKGKKKERSVRPVCLLLDHRYMSHKGGWILSQSIWLNNLCQEPVSTTENGSSSK